MGVGNKPGNSVSEKAEGSSRETQRQELLKHLNPEKDGREGTVPDPKGCNGAVKNVTS